MKGKWRLIAAWAACAVWMAVIFSMSAMPGDVSGAHSGMIARLSAALLPSSFAEDAQAMERIETLIRKLAHMAEYAVLFLLLRNALRLSGVNRPGRNALLLSAGYAATDEFHQRFVPDRGPSVGDVLIDIAGALAAWGITAAAGSCAARKHKD